MYQRILIALEGKETDTPVLAHVKTLALQTKAEVTLLRVITVADDGGHGLGRQFQIEIGSSGWRRKNLAETYLSQLECRLRQAGLRVETALVVGSRSEADEIVSYAAQNGFDLIAMPSDSRPWYQRLLREAQDDDVLRKATVPTLFISDGTRTAPAAHQSPKANPTMAALGTPTL